MYFRIILLISSLLSAEINNVSYAQIDTMFSGIKIFNLGSVINTKAEEFSPSITLDGITFYFCSNRKGSIPKPDGRPSYDIWVTKTSTPFDTVFSVPELFDNSKNYGRSGVNTYYNEGALTIAADDSKLYFTGCNRGDGFGDCDIYVSFYVNDGAQKGWSKAAPLNSNVNSPYWDSQPSLSPQKDRLYFVSNRPGPNGKNNMDIWYCNFNFNEKQWDPARNLTEVNTPGVEFSPFIGFDGVTLFFSSNGIKPNYGRLDIYATRFDATINKWSKPVNLGKPLNTNTDDYFLICSPKGDIIYFSSFRKDIPGYQGGSDLYIGYLKTALW